MGAASAQMRHLPLPCARLLSRVEAAAYCGVSPTTFDTLVAERLMPRPKRLRARILWDVRQLDSAIEDLPGGEENAVSGACDDW